MTVATATFQGMPYLVGSRYKSDISLFPAVPAEVQMTTTLFPDSDRTRAQVTSSSGRASRAGLFGLSQGMKPVIFDRPGEYYAHLVAKYTDTAGHLWVCSVRHGGVVYPQDSSIVAHGKKMRLGGEYFDRAETHTGGGRSGDDDTKVVVEPAQGYLNYPYRAGDVLLIASDPQKSNYVVPVLTMQLADSLSAYSHLEGAGATNVRMETSNGLSAHLFPEFVTTWAYYYSSAARPGFMSRFFVAEDGIQQPYWSTERSNFGRQINASDNGDLPGDIYRLLGGIVVRSAGKKPAYAGYIASAFILPPATRNNRIIAAGSEDLIGPDSTAARCWLAGTRPGTVYDVGTPFRPAIQVDPLLPADITFTLEYPDGHKVSAKGTADSLGQFAGRDPWILSEAGVYRYALKATWNGFSARMPGFPAEGGQLYVIEADPPPANVGLSLDLPPESTFAPPDGAEIAGRSTAKTVFYTAIIPGSVVEQGELPVENGRFRYKLDPSSINARFKTYDIVNRLAFRPEVKKVLHITFFSSEIGPEGRTYHSFVRLIVRGNRVLYTR